MTEFGVAQSNTPTWLSADLKSEFSAARLMVRAPANRWNSILLIPSDNLSTTLSAQEAVDAIGAAIRRVSVGGHGAKEWLVIIPPRNPNGFAVDIISSGGRINALFGELDVEFETLEEALKWVRRALSAEYQLRTTVISGQPREWRLEPVNPSVSGGSIASGHLVWFRSLRATAEVVRRNGLPSLVASPII